MQLSIRYDFTKQSIQKRKNRKTKKEHQNNQSDLVYTRKENQNEPKVFPHLSQYHGPLQFPPSFTAKRHRKAYTTSRFCRAKNGARRGLKHFSKKKKKRRFSIFSLFVVVKKTFFFWASAFHRQGLDSEHRVCSRSP